MRIGRFLAQIVGGGMERGKRFDVNLWIGSGLPCIRIFVLHLLEKRENARAMTWIPSEYYILVVSDFALAVVVCKFALCLSPELGSFEATAATFSQVDEEHLLQWRLSLREVLPPNDLSQLLWRKTL